MVNTTDINGSDGAYSLLQNYFAVGVTVPLLQVDPVNYLSNIEV